MQNRKKHENPRENPCKTGCFKTKDMKRTWYLICKYGSGVQKTMENLEGEDYCRKRCGAIVNHALSHSDDAARCAAYAAEYHAAHDDEWRRAIRKANK